MDSNSLREVAVELGMCGGVAEAVLRRRRRIMPCRRRLVWRRVARGEGEVAEEGGLIGVGEERRRGQRCRFSRIRDDAVGLFVLV